MKSIQQFYQNYPLRSILILAFAVRLVAVIFSQGYAFSDDHFLVVEAGQGWIEQNSWNDWMPEMQKKIYPDKEPVAEGHSLVYAGVHYVLFSVMEFFGLYNPKAKMYLIRLIHALFSLLIVLYGYRIANHYAGQKAAKLVGLLLALLWVMPFLSVHNLVEIVCIPFILWGLWMLIEKEDGSGTFKYYMWAGFIITLAVSIRFQTVVIVGGTGLVLLFRRQWKPMIAFGLGGLISFILLQSVIDYFIWGKPFAEFIEYVRYNLEAKNEYGHNIWYMYTTVLGGLIPPPLSLFLFIGWFLVLRKHPLLFWPSFLFFAFHNYFPNKQERFILPILPLFIIAGVIGWWQYMDKSAFWQKNRSIFKYTLVFFWVINFMALPVFSTTYSKRSRCETMYYLGKLTDADAVIIEESVRKGTTLMPMFYGGKDIQLYQLDSYEITDTLDYVDNRKILRHDESIITPFEITYNGWSNPQYAVFVNERELEKRVEKLKHFYPGLEYVETINPSYIDVIMRKITPSNNNQYVFIYKLNAGKK